MRVSRRTVTETQPWHHRWQRVDETDDPSWYVRFLDASRRGTLAQIQANPGAYYAFLEPAPGLRILDVGSGTGSLLAPLAPLLQPGGSIIGIDVSTVMVREANRRAAELQLPVEFQQGDAQQLRFADASFDRAIANQLLVHLDAPERAVSEMVRVTRPRGLVAIWEGDWETLVVDAQDRGVTRQIMNFFCDSMPQGWIGRTLPRLLADAGLVDVRVQPETLILPDAVWLDPDYGFGRISEFAERAGAITAADREVWQAHLERRSRDSGLFVAFTGFRAVGRRP
jgi:SAM-dependent methyltransferase